MKVFNYSCQGESHIATNKPCQDYSYSDSNEAMSIAIVCDGHGGEKYIRSDIGAQTATEVIKDCVSEFVKGKGELFHGKPFTQGVGSEVKNSAKLIRSRGERFKLSSESDEDIDNVFKQLFGAIVINWREKIHTHYNENPIETDVEIEKLYGCTLMCFVITNDYYFAFHLGDGKCIAFDVCPGYTVVWSEPIPWDDRCFLNKTTSICEENAVDEFRYCYCGDGKFPIAIFLGSDGIDDSFGPDENMINFYVSILKLIVKQGHDAMAKEIEETLPQLSKIGSKDDMSVACIYNEELIAKWFIELVRWQINKIKNSEIYEKERKRNDLLQKIEYYSKIDNHSTKDDIELNYAKQDIQKLDNEIEKLNSRVEKLQQELQDYETSRGCSTEC